MAITTKPYKLFHVPTHRVGVDLRQPGTQRHARIQNTGGVTTTTKYLQADQWRWVPFLVGVYLRQPGSQRHARIQNTGGVTTTIKYLQADQWRWVPFFPVQLYFYGSYFVMTSTRDQAVLVTEGKVADHVQEDTSTHWDGEIKEEGANNVETVVEGPSNSEHQDGVDQGPSDGVDEGPSDGVDEGPSDGVDEGPSDGVDEGPSDGVDEGPSDGVDEGPSDGVDEGPSDGVDEGPSDGVDEGPSDGEEKILHYLYLTGRQRF
eukprot:Em0007g1408a